MKRDNWKYFNLVFVAVLLIVVIAAVMAMDEEEDGGMVQLDMSQGGTVVDEGPSEPDREPGVPLSETDESMERNASNEADRGMTTDYWVTLPGGGSREATAEEIYRWEAGGIELAFEHVAPGEYSEVYGSVTGIPGESYTVTLTGPGVVNPQPKTVVVGEEGYTRVTWRITQFGTYQAVYHPEGDTADFFKKEASIEVR